MEPQIEVEFVAVIVKLQRQLVLDVLQVDEVTVPALVMPVVSNLETVPLPVVHV